MAFVVTETCIKCKYTDCVEVCPVDCFYEGPDFLVIHPDECIDCALCEPECPIDAILSEDELPDDQIDFIEINARLSEVYENITEAKDPLPEAEKYETVKNDLESLSTVVKNNGTILCDDYDLTYAPGVKKAIDEYVIKRDFNLRILNSRFAEITINT